MNNGGTESRERERDLQNLSNEELIKELKEKELQIKKLVGGGFMAAKVHNELFEIPSEERDQDEIQDGYQLKFIGKSYAKLQADQETETVITPDFEHNSKTQNTNSENIFITGDNLDALKHLQKAYSGKVDVIYIDPPYNTGSDGFVYADNFKFSDDDLKEKLNLTEEEISRVRALSGKSSHSAWLTFMLPRLMIAKQLLSDTGVIFISIDENEFANLKMLCDEIFTETNFIENFIWVKNSTKNLSKTTSTNHEYVFCYAKNIRNVENDEGIFRIEKEGFKQAFKIVEDMKKSGATPKEAEEALRIFYNKNKNTNLKGVSAYRFVDENFQIFASDNTSAPISSGKSKNIYEIIHPKTGKPTKTPSTGWRFGREKFLELIKEDRILFGEDENRVPRFKRFLSEQETEVVRSIQKDFTDGKKELMRLFDGNAYFENAKPTTLIKQFIKIHQKNAVVLDFFAGSATTADAVMQLNEEDGGNRKYILVQLPEKVSKNSEAEKAGYKTIDQISRERIIRAAAKIGDESGFKHFHLTEPENENLLIKMEEFNPEANVAFPEDMTTIFNGGKETILQTWLIEDGFEFNQKPEIIEFAGYKAHYIKNRLYLIETGWSSEATRELLNKIGKNQLEVQTIVIFPYSFSFNELNELKINLRTAFEKANKVQVLERY